MKHTHSENIRYRVTLTDTEWIVYTLDCENIEDVLTELCDEEGRDRNTVVSYIREDYTPEPTQSAIYTAAEDLPLFTGQPVESRTYDARGYQPKDAVRQLDMFKENEQ